MLPYCNRPSASDNQGVAAARSHARTCSQGAIRRCRVPFPFCRRTRGIRSVSPLSVWSSHTTAGFLDRSLAARLTPESVPGYLEAFRALFPENAGYEHDRLDRRNDLDPKQRAIEPRNADSHLAFIAGGCGPVLPI